MPNCFSLMVFALLIAFAATQSQAGQRSSQQQQLRAADRQTEHGALQQQAVCRQVGSARCRA